jgi:5-methylcytosine-specific restriction endonuclease McrA
MLRICPICRQEYGVTHPRRIREVRRTPYETCHKCKNEIEENLAAVEAQRMIDEYNRIHSRYQIVETVESKLKQIKSKDDARVKSGKRRALEKNAPGKYSIKYIEYLLVKQCNKCIACLVDIANNYHVDHIYPLAKGGGNGEDNIQLLCPPCNTKKNARDPIEFLIKNKLRTYCDI